MARMATELATTRTSFARPGSWLQIGGLRRLAIRHLDLPIGDLPGDLDGFRILHISDLHLTARWHEGYDRAIETIASLEADVILCTGDIVEDKTTHVPARPQIRRLLPALRSRLGLFTILGNHDNFELGRELPELGITLLNGDRLGIAGGSLELIGTPGLHRVDLPEDFAARFAGPVRGVPRILMGHFPDHFLKLRDMEPDIYLAGHTHGGQVCLPGGRPIIRHDSQPRELCRGSHRRGKTHYIVNHGFGCSTWPIRLFCPPEIVLITLRPE